MKPRLCQMLGSGAAVLLTTGALAVSLPATSCAQRSGTQEHAVSLAAVPHIQDIVDRVSLDSVRATLREFEAFGLKAPGTDALAATADWIEARYRALGYDAIARHDVEFRDHTLQNVIVTKAGTATPNRVLLLSGHYDTARGPGVNDNGSGIAIMLEVARVLADLDTDLSVRFANFSGEEVGLVGSRAYVEEIVVPEGTDILLVLNIDEVGGMAGAVNDVITCERDERPPDDNNAVSAAYTDSLAALTRAYTSLGTHIDRAFGSDYLPFQSAGYVITGFYETTRSRYPHTPDDTLANLDVEYVTEIARATVAAVLHFARRNAADGHGTP